MPLSQVDLDDVEGIRSLKLFKKNPLFCLMDSTLYHGTGARVRKVTDASGNTRRTRQEEWCAKTGDKDNE